MGCKESMIKSIQNEIVAYYDHLVYLKDLIAVCDDMSGIKRDFGEVQNNNFLKVSYAAVIDSMMITISRLVDTDKNAMSIQSLIRKVKNNAHIVNDKQAVLNKIDEFEKTLIDSEYISTRIEIIKHRRDTMFAHNDKKYFLNPDKDDSYLPMYKIWFVRDFIEQVLLYFSSVFDVTLEKKMIYNGDIRVLLNYGIDKGESLDE